MDTDIRASHNTSTVQFVRPEVNVTAPGHLKVIRRNGTLTTFNANKITVAMTSAFLAVEGDTAAGSSRVNEIVDQLVNKIATAFKRRMPEGGTLHIEDIQDQVELVLMRAGEHKVARAYVLYREERRKIREQEQALASRPTIHITLDDGHRVPLDLAVLTLRVKHACKNLVDVSPNLIVEDTERNLFDGVPAKDVNKALIMSARVLIEKEPNYSFVAARLLLDELHTEALGFLKMKAPADPAEMNALYPEYLEKYIDRGIELELLDPQLKKFDLKKLSAALEPERDLQFNYLGLQTLYDRYFIHSHGVRFPP